jgi:hypothetical protein
MIMKSIKNIFRIYPITIVTLFFASASFAQDNKNDAEYQKIVKEYTLHPDGSVTYHYAHSIKLLTYFSFTTAYGETHIVYNTKFQNAKVNYARTTMADGKVVSSPPNAFNEILPGFAANAPAYNHIRDLVVTHTGLERNAVVDVDYEVNSQVGFYPELMGNECLKTSAPIKEYTIKVTIPTNPDKPLQYKLLNYTSEPKIVSDSVTTTYTWTFKNLPALTVEKFRPHVSETEPYLLFSTSLNQQKVYLRFVNRKFLNFESDDKLREFVYSLMDKNKPELDFILKVQDVIANQVKTYNIPLNYTGYDPQTPLQVFYSNGGTPVEKAALMIAMLNIGLVRAFPEWVGPRALVFKEMGNLNVFDEVYVRVYTDPEKYIHLPVTQRSKNNMNLFSDYKAFLLIDPESKYAKTVVVPLNQPQTFDYKVEMVIKSPEAYQAKVIASFGQGANPYYDILRDSTTIINRILQNVQLPKDGAKKIDLSDPAQSSFSFDITSPAKAFLNEKNFWFLTLPKSNEGFDSWQLTALPDGRTVPLQLASALNESYTYTISLPKNYQVVGLPTNLKITNNTGSVNIEIRQQKKKIIVTRALSISKSMIPVEEYKQFQELINIWRTESNKPFIYKIEQKK